MATAAQMAAFIEMMAPIAMEQCKKHDKKIFASVCLAQAIHESGWGTAAKMVRANAVFGIKVGSSAYKFGTAWKGKAYKTGTTEYYDAQKQVATKIVDWFRAYDSLSDATEDYYDMLCHCKRYAPAMNRATPKECIEAIVSGGYATGPSYAQRIMDLIRQHNLTRYDEGDISDTNPYRRVSNLLKTGSRGESVKWLQWELNRHGANLKIDGIFGQQTKLAVLLYQKDHSLVQDGIVGKKTLLSLGVIF